MTGQDRPQASGWVRRFSGLLKPGATVLDLACGSGRHTALLVSQGCRVTALDRDRSRLGGLAGNPAVEVVEADLEAGSPFPLAGRTFDGIVVTNYLHRPLFDPLLACLPPGGLLIYETFAEGNERFGKPSNPDFLLKPGELLRLALDNGLRVLAYEDLEVEHPKPACVQRIAARKPS